MHAVDLASFAEPDAIISPHAFLTDDPDTWDDHMTPKLAAFLTQQSRDRTWEIAPGLVAAFEPGEFLETEMAAMVDQTTRFAQLLSAAFGDPGAPASAGGASRSASSLASATESAG